MSSYKIKPLQREKAKNLGLTIKPSTNKRKKVDVFKGKDKVGSIGATGYMDFSSYLKRDGQEVADKKRKAYLARHAKEPKMKKGKRTNSYYADKILW